jgi:dynein heavy chain
LDIIQKSLSKYLEEKRSFFPRFFFLSDDQLLEILAQTKDPNMVQKHVNKCFEAINLLDFNPNQEVVGMISPEKEKVAFVSKIDVNEGEKQGNVERWLLEIETVMRETLKQITIKSIEDTETPRTKWVLKYPAQVIIAVNMIRWTSNAENALLMIQNDPDSMSTFYEHLVKELNEIVELVRGDLSFLDR